MKNFDVLICGGGIAGTTLSLKLSRNGYKVAVFEKNKENYYYHTWSDSIEEYGLKFADIDLKKSEITVDVKKLYIYSPFYRFPKLINNYPYKIVNRKLLLQRLRLESIKNGTTFFFETEVISAITNTNSVIGVIYKYKGKKKSIEAKLTVDATGLNSIVRKSLPYSWDIDTTEIQPEDTAIAYREIRKIKKNSERFIQGRMEYCYGKFGGYTWYNRESETTLDIGAGINGALKNINPETIVKKNSELPDITKKIINFGGGTIPVRRSIYNLVWNGLIIIGDAGYQSVPTNGCNTGTILIAVQIVANLLKSLLKKNTIKLNELWQYNLIYQKTRGAILAYQDIVKHSLQSISEREIDKLFTYDIIEDEDMFKNFTISPPSINLKNFIIKLQKGLRAPRLFYKVAIAEQKGMSLYKHYMEYPEKYSPVQLHKWIKKTELFFKKL